MESLKTNIVDIINRIEFITDLFYKQKTESAFENLNVILNDLTNIIDTIYSFRNLNDNLDFDTNLFISKLSEALQAMEKGDTILLADILLYDLSEQLKVFYEAIL